MKNKSYSRKSQNAGKEKGYFLKEEKYEQEVQNSIKSKPGIHRMGDQKGLKPSKQHFKTPKENEPSKDISEGNPNIDTTTQRVRAEAQPRKAEEEIEFSENTEAKQKPKVDFYDEEALIRKIEEVIRDDQGIPEEDKKSILIDIEGGRVILSGSVSSEEVKLAIADRAMALTGFGKVDNRLTIVSQ